MADAMLSSGMVDAGYRYIFIDDGWQGGRDKRNNIIADPKKFPSGIKALADYLHQKGMKLGIYSDAAQLTCAGYTGSLHFEEQDAKTFASWGIDYLKYDYCHAPHDTATAIERYTKMAAALSKSGKEIVFGVCEWGQLGPWLWAPKAGGQLWRTTYDVRDKWKRRPNETDGEGIIDILDVNADLADYAGPGHWNDPDMLVVGLYGKKGPSGDLGGTGMTDIEYQSQMSLWSIMCAPLIATNDIRNMNEATRRILLNRELIAINQDILGQQAKRVWNSDDWNVFVKPLANGDYAVAVLNRSDQSRKFTVNLRDIGIEGKFLIRDVLQQQEIGSRNDFNVAINSHETKVYRIRKR